MRVVSFCVSNSNRLQFHEKSINEREKGGTSLLIKRGTRASGSLGLLTHLLEM